MIGNYDEYKKAWEILCDDLLMVVGYVNQEQKPNDDQYSGILCESPILFYINKNNNYINFNGEDKTPTNSLINYVVENDNGITIELNNELWHVLPSNTVIENTNYTSKDDLYEAYLNILDYVP